MKETEKVRSNVKKTDEEYKQFLTDGTNLTEWKTEKEIVESYSNKQKMMQRFVIKFPKYPRNLKARYTTTSFLLSINDPDADSRVYFTQTPARPLGRGHNLLPSPLTTFIGDNALKFILKVVSGGTNLQITIACLTSATTYCVTGCNAD